MRDVTFLRRVERKAAGTVRERIAKVMFIVRK
jgi:hypothetical protein